MVWFNSVHKGEDRDGILSTTEEPETNVADSFDGSGVGLDKLCSEFCLLFYSLMLQFSAHYSFNFTYYSFTMTIILFRNAHTNNIIQLHQHLLYCNNRYLNVVFQCRSLRFRKCICQNGKTLSAAADDGCTSSIFLKTLAQ